MALNSDAGEYRQLFSAVPSQLLLPGNVSEFFSVEAARRRISSFV